MTQQHNSPYRNRPIRGMRGVFLSAQPRNFFVVRSSHLAKMIGMHLYPVVLRYVDMWAALCPILLLLLSRETYDLSCLARRVVGQYDLIDYL